MIDPFSFSAFVAASSGLAGLGLWAWQRPGVQLVWREVRFPKDVSAAQVQALLDVMASAQHGPVLLVVESDVRGVRFLLGASVSSLGVVGHALSGIAPQVRLDAVDAPESDGFVAAGRVVWSGRWPLLRRDASELAAAGLLGALTGLGAKERSSGGAARGCGSRAASCERCRWSWCRRSQCACAGSAARGGRQAG